MGEFLSETWDPIFCYDRGKTLLPETPGDLSEASKTIGDPFKLED